MIRFSGLAVGIVVLAGAVGAAQAPAGGGQPPPPPMTNLQIIPKDTPRPQVIQTMQAFIHRNVVTGRESKRGDSLPMIVRLLQWFPVLQTLPARFIGIGPRPEHFHSPTVG